MFCQSGSQSPSFDWITAVKGGGRVISRSQVPLTALGRRLSSRSESVVASNWGMIVKSHVSTPHCCPQLRDLMMERMATLASRNREDWISCRLGGNRRGKVSIDFKNGKAD